MPIKWNKNGKRWTSGKLRIQRAERSYETEVVDGRTFRPFNPDMVDVYHQYEDGLYIGQSNSFDNSKSKMEKHKSRKDKSKKKD